MIKVIVAKKLRKFYLKYVSGLILCKTRKTCTQMGQVLGVTHDAIQRALKKISNDTEGVQEGLIGAAKHLLNRSKKWWLIVDDSMLLKPHMKKLREAIFDRCGATGRVEKGLVAIFVSITDGETTLPLAYKFWVNKKNSTPEEYKKKWEIGVDLLREVSPLIGCKSVLADGAYFNRFSLAKFIEFGFEFEGRFRKNGKVMIHGVENHVSEHLSPLVRGPRLYATVQGSWQGIQLFFTAHKHRNKSGEVAITYTLSNRNVLAIQHAKDYLLRWGIEMFFRTAKQSLGIHHCASPSVDMHRAHINACLVAYVFLQQHRIIQKHPAVENTVKFFRGTYFDNLSSALDSGDNPFQHFA